MTSLLTKAFWKRAWLWSKTNWKFLLGISIPIIISILLRKGNALAVYKKASEIREKELAAQKKAYELEIGMKQKNQDDFLSSVNDINEQHSQETAELEENRLKLIKEIDSAEKATAAIKDRLRE